MIINTGALAHFTSLYISIRSRRAHMCLVTEKIMCFNIKECQSLHISNCNVFCLKVIEMIEIKCSVQPRWGYFNKGKKRRDSLDWSRGARGAREDEVVNRNLWGRDEAQKVIVPSPANWHAPVTGGWLMASDWSILGSPGDFWLADWCTPHPSFC